MSHSEYPKIRASIAARFYIRNAAVLRKYSQNTDKKNDLWIFLQIEISANCADILLFVEEAE